MVRMKAISSSSSQGMILVITLVLIAIIATLSLGVINTGLLQSHLGQSLVNASVSKHAGLSMLYQIIKESKADTSSDNWLIRAKANPIILCLSNQNLIKTNCDSAYDSYHGLQVIGNLKFISTDNNWLIFDLNISIKQIKTQEVMKKMNYQLLFQPSANNQMNIRYR